MLPGPSQMFTAAFPCCRSSLLRAKVFPFPHLRIPHSACALQIAVLNTQWYLWSWPQVINSRCKTQVVHRKGFYKTKGCPLPERWDLRPQLTPLHRRFLSGALIAHADVCKAGAIPKEGSSAPSNYPWLQAVAQEGCFCGQAAKNNPRTQSWKRRLPLNPNTTSLIESECDLSQPERRERTFCLNKEKKKKIN